MQYFARVLLRRQWWVIVGLVLVTLTALVGMTRLQIDPSNERLLPRQGEAYQTYQQFRATFGSDEDILVALHDPQHPLVAPAGLAAIRLLTQELAALPLWQPSTASRMPRIWPASR